MADDSHRKLLSVFVQEALTLSLGVAAKGVELVTHPEGGAGKIVATMKDLVTIPEGVPGGAQGQVQALAGVWIEKGVQILSECRSAGEKFTEGK